MELINQNITKEIAEKLIEAIRKKMEDAGVNASGNLSDSLESVTNDTGFQILAENYFQYAETGRPAGKVPAAFGDILTKWVEDKHLNIPDKYKNSRQFGWAIAHNIKTYGSARHRDTNPVDLLSDAIDEVMPIIDELMGNAFLTTINDSLEF